MSSVLYILLLPSFLCTFISCREEIIPPDNPATNKNEIVQSTTYYTYTFSIDADNITFENNENPRIRSLRTRITYYLSDYQSGTADISIYSNSLTMYSNSISHNTSGFYYDLNGYYPTNIIIKCTNFTGKLKVQLTRL